MKSILDTSIHIVEPLLKSNMIFVILLSLYKLCNIYK